MIFYPCVGDPPEKREQNYLIVCCQDLKDSDNHRLGLPWLLMTTAIAFAVDPRASCKHFSTSWKLLWFLEKIFNQ